MSDRRDVFGAKFVASHVYATHRAIERGLRVRGYLYWSLNDSYEWAYGFKQKFGLSEVDLATKGRGPRSSARVYGEIATGSALRSDRLGLVAYEDRPPRSIS